MIFMSFRKILIYKMGKINPAASEHLCGVKGVLNEPLYSLLLVWLVPLPSLTGTESVSWSAKGQQ